LHGILEFASVQPVPTAQFPFEPGATLQGLMRKNKAALGRCFIKTSWPVAQKLADVPRGSGVALLMPKE
jgi:hypothetical protein